MQHGIDAGQSSKEVEDSIFESDSRAFEWTEFLYDLEPWDAKLYDLILPIDTMSDDAVAAYISEQCAQGTLLETVASRQSIADMALAASVEMALLQKGHVLDLQVRGEKMELKVNKSVLSFENLRRELNDIIAPLAPGHDIDIKMGPDYQDSIYRDQEFKLPPKVLLVDDEKDFVLTLSERLLSRNVGSYAVYDGQEALSFLENDTPDVMVLDLKMPGVDGLEVLKKTKQDNPGIEIIILTGHGSEEDKKNCLALGAFAYLQKPTDIQTLSAKIHEAHTKTLAEAE